MSENFISRFEKWLRMSENFFLDDEEKCQKMNQKSIKMTGNFQNSWAFQYIYTSRDFSDMFGPITEISTYAAFF